MTTSKIYNFNGFSTYVVFISLFSRYLSFVLWLYNKIWLYIYIIPVCNINCNSFGSLPFIIINIIYFLLIQSQPVVLSVSLLWVRNTDEKTTQGIFEPGVALPDFFYRSVNFTPAFRSSILLLLSQTPSTLVESNGHLINLRKYFAFAFNHRMW